MYKKREIVILTCKFQLHSMKLFFKMATSNILRWQPPPPYPQSLTAYPTPPEGEPPQFFRQNDCKGCILDCIDGFGHFRFGFGAAGV